MSAASQAPLQRGAVEDGMRGKAASYGHCRTAVPSPNYTVNLTTGRAGRSSDETSSPALHYRVAGRAPRLGCSNVQDMCVDHLASLISAAGQAPPQFNATEDGIRGMAANYELCHTAVASCNPTIGRAERSSNETSDPATITLSQARTVTLRQRVETVWWVGWVVETVIARRARKLEGLAVQYTLCREESELFRFETEDD